MENAQLIIEPTGALSGKTELVGAKNAVLVIMASLILTEGKSKLTNVPYSQDVLQMITLLEQLGADIFFDVDARTLEVDTSQLHAWRVSPDIMQKMRASVLVMGPLLARFAKADIALPGGCVIGSRPIDYHIKNFKKMGVIFSQEGDFLSARLDTLKATTYVLEYPSTGATENLLMASILAPGETKIINAALEPEVADLICVLSKMGAKIEIQAPATIIIQGVTQLSPIEHAIIPDRLEAGALLLAAAITGGSITIDNAKADTMDVFLIKLQEMGHDIRVHDHGVGITLHATHDPHAVSFKTGPYPGFPTDLQAPMMAAQAVARGQSIIEETVFENRMLHVRELQKMGAQIDVHYNKAIVNGVDELFGAQVIATDIRASCALLLAGLVAQGTTVMTGIAHFRRGYDFLEQKLTMLGASVRIVGDTQHVIRMHRTNRKEKHINV